MNTLTIEGIKVQPSIEALGEGGGLHRTAQRKLESRQGIQRCCEAGAK